MSSIIDDKGRITLPKELRKKFGLVPGEIVDFVIVNEKILLRKKITAKSFMKRSDKLSKKFDEISENNIDVEKLF